MRKLVIAVFLACSCFSAAQAQQFSTPIDLVETLYSSYFNGLAPDDFAPYLSDDLTDQMNGKIGVSEFKLLGFDPIVGEPNWEPRNFKAELLQQSHDQAEVKVAFISHAVPVSITLALIFEPLHGWQIEHISGAAGNKTWCTNDLLALKPLD